MTDYTAIIPYDAPGVKLFKPLTGLIELISCLSDKLLLMMMMKLPILVCGEKRGN